MTRISQDVSFGLGIFHEVLAHDLLFIEDFHGVLATSWNGFAVFFQVELLYHIDLAKGSLSELRDNLEVIWANAVFFPAIKHVFGFFFTL